MRSGRVANLKVETTEASRRAYSVWPRATSASDPTTTSDIRNLPIPACDGRTKNLPTPVKPSPNHCRHLSRGREESSRPIAPRATVRFTFSSSLSHQHTFRLRAAASHEHPLPKQGNDRPLSSYDAHSEPRPRSLGPGTAAVRGQRVQMTKTGSSGQGI